MAKRRSTFRRRILSRERTRQERDDRRLENNRVVGHAREDYVASVLQYAVDQRAILKARATVPFSSEDLMGWDIVIVDLRGQVHPLQVKGDERLALNSRDWYPDVGIVVVKLTYSQRGVLDRVIQALPQIPELKTVTVPL